MEEGVGWTVVCLMVNSSSCRKKGIKETVLRNLLENTQVASLKIHIETKTNGSAKACATPVRLINTTFFST